MEATGQVPQVPTPYNMPQQSSAQNILSGMIGGGQPGPQWASWPGYGSGAQPPPYGTPEYVPQATHQRPGQQLTPPVPAPPGMSQTPQVPNPQYPGASGNFTGQQPVPPPGTQPDMNSVMNNLVSGAAQNLGGAQAQPQIHPAIQQFQGMMQGLQTNPQMVQALFGAMPGGLQGFLSLLQPLMGAMPQVQGQGGAIKSATGTVGNQASGGNLSQGALAMLKSLQGDKGQNIAEAGASATNWGGQSNIQPVKKKPPNTVQIR